MQRRQRAIRIFELLPGDREARADPKRKSGLFCPCSARFSGLRREKRPAVPDSVIREAVFNAVCHRDYSIANRRTAVYIFRDRLEIISPGRLPNTLTVEKILTGNSAPRNTFLLKYLDNMKFILEFEILLPVT
ncbi:MAG: ATP-binding protein [Candidatus Electrothrix sp. YB6]